MRPGTRTRSRCRSARPFRRRTPSRCASTPASRGRSTSRIVALDDSGHAIGSAAGDVDVKPSQATTLPLTLTPLVPPPPGSTLAFTTQPMDALAKSALAPVQGRHRRRRRQPGDQHQRAHHPRHRHQPVERRARRDAHGQRHAGRRHLQRSHHRHAPAPATRSSPARPGSPTSPAPPSTSRASGWVAGQTPGLSGGVINDLILDPKHPRRCMPPPPTTACGSRPTGAPTGRAPPPACRARHGVDALALDPVTTTTIVGHLQRSRASTSRATAATRGCSRTSDERARQASTPAIAVDTAHPIGGSTPPAGRAVVRTGDGGADVERRWRPTRPTAPARARSPSIRRRATVWVAQFGDGLATMPYNGHDLHARRRRRLATSSPARIRT